MNNRFARMALIGLLLPLLSMSAACLLFTTDDVHSPSPEAVAIEPASPTSPLDQDEPEQAEPDKPEVDCSHLKPSESGDDDHAPRSVRMAWDRLEVSEPIYFKSNSATILEQSYLLLDQMAYVLCTHREIEKLRIEVHTDSQGAAAYNKRISQKRADAILEYLTRSIDPERLEAAGMGQEYPLESNRTADERARNRRIEFWIVDAGPPQPE
ncbi:MAG: OmpA family protein [Bradymonadaceae bacterium]